jgi:GNAT superfamily N-acetyltransferase
MRLAVHAVADLTAANHQALQNLSREVYPPDIAAAWPGNAIEWAPPQWCIIGWDADGAVVCHVGIVLRSARWNQRAVKVGGIGGVKTHPAWRRRGFATAAIECALNFLRDQGDVDFGLLVCELILVPFYARLGWQRFDGELFVTQKNSTVPFTFNLPMTIPLCVEETLRGTIDILGPPW